MPNDTAEATDTSYRTPRDVRINGNPPRIPPLKPEEFTDEVREMTADLQRAAGVPVNGYVPDFIATMLRYPELHTAHTDLALLLMAKGALSVRDRELAVCRVGWLCQAPFEWDSHVAMGKRQAGMTDEEIEWVIVGSSAPGWTEHERAVIRSVEELMEDSMISDETWAVLARTLDYKQLLELPILVGQYMGVAFVQNSIRVNLMPGAVGLSAR
jgi:4-carboxymuconolactone decarboxylase